MTIVFILIILIAWIAIQTYIVYCLIKRFRQLRKDVDNNKKVISNLIDDIVWLRDVFENYDQHVRDVSTELFKIQYPQFLRKLNKKDKKK